MRPNSRQALLHPVAPAPPQADPGYVQPDWKKSRVLCIRGTTCFAIMLCIVAVGFSWYIVNFSVGAWSRLGGDTKSRKYGLFTCNSGPAEEEGTSLYCLSKHACEGGDHENGLCQTAKFLYYAGSSFLGLELFSMTLAIMLVERVLYMCFTRPYGWCGIVFCIGAWIFITHLTAVSFWFGISEAEFDVSCENQPKDSDTTWNVCAETGAVTATIGVAVCAVLGLSTCFMQFHRPAEVDRTSQRIGLTKVWGFRTRDLALGIVLLLLGQLGLMVANLSVRTWVRTAGSPGSLFALENWGQYTHMGYDCIKVPVCLDFPDSGVCNTFTYLHSAGIAYLVCTIGAIVFFVLFMESTIHYYYGFEFGVPVVNYFWGAISGMFQTLGLILWLAVSGAGFSGDCEKVPQNGDKGDLDKGDLDVCMSSGFLLAFTSVLLWWGSYTLWVLLYWRRK